MTDDLDRLDKLAEAATPGPWEADLTDPSVWGPERIIFGNYTMNDGFDSPGWEDGTSSDLEFIAAANPSVVRALVQRVRDAEAEAGRLGSVESLFIDEQERAERAEAERDAALAREAKVRELHRRTHAVFSWRDGMRVDDPCPDCDGKAGVHPCGCWADEDAEFVCSECLIGTKGSPAPWPCPTIRALDADGKETNE